MRRLISNLLTIFTVFMVYLTTKLIVGIIRKLRIKQNAHAAIGWYMSSAKGLIAKIGNTFRK